MRRASASSKSGQARSLSEIAGGFGWGQSMANAGSFQAVAALGLGA